MQASVGVAARSSLTRRLRFRKASGSRVRCRVKSQTLCFGGKFHEGRRRSHERLLRYPNGDTRLIRYPATESEADPEVDTPKDATSAQLPGKSSSSAPPKTMDLPSSPAELVRLIRSSSYIKAQKEHQKRIQESYQILERDPWVAVQKLYTLTVAQEAAEGNPQMYTLRTRQHQDAATNRLKHVPTSTFHLPRVPEMDLQMFRGPSFKGEFIQVDRITDGVITFLDLDNAERFKALLEAEDTHGVEICEMSSDVLFQGCMDAKAVVVLLHGGDYCPTIHELSTSLKAQQSLEGEP